MYQHGHGVDVNYKKAIEWYEKAVEQGHADAQYNLGFMYIKGQGVDELQEGDPVVQEGGGAGTQEAQHNLGMYHSGRGCELKAIEWYEKAWSRDTQAQYNLGHVRCRPWRMWTTRRRASGTRRRRSRTRRLRIWVSCTNGQADVNYKKAIEWYEKAAEQGYAEAQYNLVSCTSMPRLGRHVNRVSGDWMVEKATRGHCGDRESGYMTKAGDGLQEARAGRRRRAERSSV